MKPTALIITTAGINCDLELTHAFQLAGAETESIHLNRLVAEPSLIDRYDLIGLPGGFSYGDAVAAGRIAAALMRQSLYPAFVRAIQRGVPIIAPCNGFQIAAQMGLLPGPAPAPAPGSGEAWPDEAPTATVALIDNASARFSDRWVRFSSPRQTRCIWTRGVKFNDQTGLLPIAHGEGRFVTASPDILHQLVENGQVALRYAADDNPNGSEADIAGICDASGLVFGLMPHPERYTRWTQHPWWTRLKPLGQGITAGDPPGLQIFRNAVRHVQRQGATVQG